MAAARISGPCRDGTIMAELLPKVAELCAKRAFPTRDVNMSKADHLLERRCDITDDLYYSENYKIGVKALADLYEHDAIADPYLNAAARIVTRCVTTVACRNIKEKLRSMDYLQPRQGGVYTSSDIVFINSVRQMDNLLRSNLQLTPEQKGWCSSEWEKERRRVDNDDLLDHICRMQDVHVHLNTCRWSKRLWRLETWDADEKPFCMSLNQAICQNKNTNVTAMYVSASYDEWEIDIAWQVSQEVVWQCEDNNKSYWRYIDNNFEGSEELFNEWVQEEYEMDSPRTEPWGTPSEMEYFANEKDMYEYYDDMCQREEEAVEEAQFRMDNDW